MSENLMASNADRIKQLEEKLRWETESRKVAAAKAWEFSDRIKQLETALYHCVNAIAEVEKCKPELLTYEMAFNLRPYLLGAMDNARAALDGGTKDV